MSASEKLRALDASATEPPWHEGRVVSGEDGFLWFGERGDLLPEDIAFVVALRNALPLIADVVEAAEAAPSQVCYNAEVGWGQCEGITDRGEWERVACSACRLRDALTALREHLEGGDVT